MAITASVDRLDIILSLALAQVLPEPGLIAVGALCLAIAAGLVGRALRLW